MLCAHYIPVYMYFLIGDRVYAYQMVRTDSREQKLDAFVIPKEVGQSSLATNMETTRPGEECSSSRKRPHEGMQK